MEKEEAIKVIEQAVNAGTIKGIYSLADIKIILQAIEVIKF